MRGLYTIPHGTSLEGNHHLTQTGPISSYFLLRKTHSQIHCFQGTKQLFFWLLLICLDADRTRWYGRSGWKLHLLCLSHLSKVSIICYPCILSSLSLLPHHIWVVGECQWALPSPNTSLPNSFISIIPKDCVCIKPVSQAFFIYGNHWHACENNRLCDLLQWRVIQQTSVLGLLWAKLWAMS